MPFKREPEDALGGIPPIDTFCTTHRQRVQFIGSVVRYVAVGRGCLQEEDIKEGGSPGMTEEHRISRSKHEGDWFLAANSL